MSTKPAVLRPVERPQETDWKALAEATAKRLNVAEESLRETRAAADEMRGRMTKYKARLDNAQGEVNRLQAQVVELTAALERKDLEHDAATADMRSRLARQEVLKRTVYEYRESLLNGPLFELFGEL